MKVSATIWAIWSFEFPGNGLIQGVWRKDDKARMSMTLQVSCCRLGLQTTALPSIENLELECQLEHREVLYIVRPDTMTHHKLLSIIEKISVDSVIN